MLTIAFRFPGGRYHATPWGHHVNEGLVEWPPSPWRLVRAFIATAFTKLHETDPLPEDHVLRRLVTTLASALPAYRLPRCTATHSRHYMPLGGKDGKTTLVLDTCAVIGKEPIIVEWPVELDDECRDYLTRILAAIGYLGRAESWVEAGILPDETSVGGDLCQPHAEGMAHGPGWEQVALLAPLPASEYADWRSGALKAMADEPPAATRRGKRPKKPFAQQMPAYPEDLYDCLTRDTAFWQAHGWSQPPGSRKVLYWRKTWQTESAAPITTRRAKEPAPVEAVLLALASDTRQREVLPLFSRALPQAELLHRSLVSLVGGGTRADCPSLIGRDAEGWPLSGHRHLQAIPLSLDAPNRIDHFLLWAPMGFDGAAQRAIVALRRTWMKGGEGSIFVTVAGMGRLSDLAKTISSGANIFGPASTWVSRTPFVPPRHVKKGGSNTLEGQIQSELASRGLPAATKVEVMAREEWVKRRFHRFILGRREPAKPPPQECGLGLRLTFDRPLRGPVCLGYASHFGLGSFAAEEKA